VDPWMGLQSPDDGAEHQRNVGQAEALALAECLLARLAPGDDGAHVDFHPDGDVWRGRDRAYHVVGDLAADDAGLDDLVARPDLDLRLRRRLARWWGRRSWSGLWRRFGRYFGLRRARRRGLGQVGL